MNKPILFTDTFTLTYTETTAPLVFRAEFKFSLMTKANMESPRSCGMAFYLKPLAFCPFPLVMKMAPCTPELRERPAIISTPSVGNTAMPLTACTWPLITRFSVQSSTLIVTIAVNKMDIVATPLREIVLG